MAGKKRYLTATMPDSYVKTIDPTSSPLTHCWRIVAYVGGGQTSLVGTYKVSEGGKEQENGNGSNGPAGRQPGWARYDFEVVELVVSFDTSTSNIKI